MKKLFSWGIMFVLMIILTACSKDNPTFIDNTKVIDDKKVFQQEIQIDKQSETKLIKEEIETIAKAVTMQKEDQFNQKQSGEESTYSSLNNDKKGWGLKRNTNHEPPQVSKSISDTLEKYNAFYIGDKNEKIVYLTFDEGYENGYTSQILDVLKKNNVYATFFITAPYIQRNPELVERMINEGHIIGNHTINHKSMPDLSIDQLEKEVVGLDRMVYEKWKVNMKYMRPPMGEYSERTLAQLSDLGYKTVFWSFAYKDYDVKDQKGTDYAYKMIMDNLHSGSVLLIHAVSKDNANALDSVIKAIKSQGYKIKNLDEFK